MHALLSFLPLQRLALISFLSFFKCISMITTSFWGWCVDAVVGTCLDERPANHFSHLRVDLNPYCILGGKPHPSFQPQLTSAPGGKGLWESSFDLVGVTASPLKNHTASFSSRRKKILSSPQDFIIN